MFDEDKNSLLEELKASKSSKKSLINKEHICNCCLAQLIMHNKINSIMDKNGIRNIDVYYKEMKAYKEEFRNL